ncbi:MAG: glutamyl-tRNA reductase [Muriicola sp.]|nr:glutamyl-tRNA reductase [Muriicola sp.]
MSNQLRYISISHISANVADRERFFIADEQKRPLLLSFKKHFPDINGLMLLVTCNRTEVYFESDQTSASKLLEFLLKERLGTLKNEDISLFVTSDDTETTAKHLLSVSTGLLSKVWGDAEIIHQVRKAYKTTLEMKLQGSLLERAIQMVFRNHKRVRNETQFRDGTTSVAYKSLKMIVATYGMEEVEDKKILIIGAGDIVKQWFKYNRKFNFKKIAISNRTLQKAQDLASQHGAEVYSWEKVVANDFSDFDIIIGAAGNSHHLVNRLNQHGKSRLLIDLGLPSNIDPQLSEISGVKLYNLDAISTAVEKTKVQREKALEVVSEINREELLAYREWLQEAPLRKLLAQQKPYILNNTAGYLKRAMDIEDSEKINTVANRVIRQLYHKRIAISSAEDIRQLIAAQSFFGRPSRRTYYRSPKNSEL